jgi:hypothetical protein
MFNELDVVALTVDLPADGLVAGNVGTIVQVYAPDAYEVEFVDNNGHTYGLVTLTRQQIMRLQFAPVAIV